MYMLSLTGDRYQIGFQHGRKLRQLVHYAIRRQQCRFYRGMGCPSPVSLQRYARAIESSFPELMAEMRGIADGSRLPLNDILIHNLTPVPDSCSNVAFLRNCMPMLGHVNDDAEGSLDVAFHVRSTEGQEVLHIGTAGSVGTGAAVNSGGLAMSHACARSNGSVNSDAHLNLRLLRRLLIDRSNNCDEARRFLATHSFMSGADNIICADRTGSGFVAEKLPTTVEFREPTDGGIFCTGRALTMPVRSAVQQDAYEDTKPEEIASLVARETLFSTVLAGPEHALSLRLMQQLLQNTDEGVEVSNEKSTWGAVLIPSDFRMWIADGLPCQSKFRCISRTSRSRFI